MGLGAAGRWCGGDRWDERGGSDPRDRAERLCGPGLLRALPGDPGPVSTVDSREQQGYAYEQEGRRLGNRLGFRILRGYPAVREQNRVCEYLFLECRGLAGAWEERLLCCRAGWRR